MSEPRPCPLCGGAGFIFTLADPPQKKPCHNCKGVVLVGSSPRPRRRGKDRK